MTPLSRTFSSEFRLCLECCRSGFAKVQPTTPPVLPGSIDWPRFAALAKFHRVQGLVWNCISEIADALPEDVAAALEAEAKTIATANLRAAVVSRILQDAFDAGNVPMLFVKGLTLGALAYSNPSAKTSIDIDLLIDPANIGKAAELLGGLGYRVVIPKPSTEFVDLREWHRRSKESAWINAESAIEVDLHTSLTDTPRLIPRIGIHSPRQMVEVGRGIALSTLGMDELFSYLAVHGAWSNWYRLKWISDVAALLHGQTADEIGRLYRRSRELGAGPAAGQCLLLADTLFGTLREAPELREMLSADRTMRALFRRGLRSLTSGAGEPTERHFGTFPIHLTHFLLLAGPSAKLVEALRKLRWALYRLRVRA